MKSKHLGLEQGLDRLGARVSPQAREQLRCYLASLKKWNAAFNLVSAGTERDAVVRHVLDCLSPLPHIKGHRVLDVGTGPGLPGIILAIANPELRCTLLDSSLKKTRFCRQVVQELGLTNAEVERVRVEDYSPFDLFDTIISRAFGPTASLVSVTRRLCRADGRVISMKGAEVQVELDGLGSMLDNTEVLKVEVPGLSAQRHLVIVDLGASSLSGRSAPAKQT